MSQNTNLRSLPSTGVVLTAPVSEAPTLASRRTRQTAAVGHALHRMQAYAPADPERRSASGEEEVRRTSQALFGAAGPLAEEGRVLREVQHFYSQRVVGHVVQQIKRTIKDGDRLFVRGGQRQVGTSTLLQDFARSFNQEAVDRGDDRRILYVAIGEGTTSIRLFLDQLAEEADAPFSLSELTTRNPKSLAVQTANAMRTYRVTALILDHIHNINKKALPFLAELIVALDPASFTVPMTKRGFAVPMEPIALIVATHTRPGQILRGLPHVANAFHGNQAVLKPYKSRQAMSDALRGANIGLDDFDLTNPEDDAIARRLLEESEGSPGVMHSIFRLLDAFGRQGECRPTLEILERALDKYKPLLAHDDGDETAVNVATRVQALVATAPDEDEAPRSPDAAQQLKRMKAEAGRFGAVQTRVARAKA